MCAHFFFQAKKRINEKLQMVKTSNAEKHS